MSAKQRVPVLDGIRAIGVLIVICFHFWLEFSSGPFSVLNKVAAWGQTSIDLFFVLSGYLITGILLDSKGSQHFLRNFYCRRVLRIFPLYYAALFTIYLLCPLLHLSEWTPWRQSLWFWVYLQNIPATFAPALASGPKHFWSLAVEEHYYLVWPLLILLLRRETLLKVTGLAVVASLAARVVFADYATFYFTLARLDGLAIGSAVAILARSRLDGLARFVPTAKRVLYICGPAIVLAQLPLSGRGVPVIPILKSTLVSLLYACFLVLAVENALGPIVGRLLSGRILGSVGKYSYAMYVVHPFILSGLHQAGVSYNVLWLFASILLTYGAGWVSWTLLEERCLRLKRYFEYAPNERARNRQRRPAPSLAVIESCRHSESLGASPLS